jgi:hypothetical protein
MHLEAGHWVIITLIIGWAATMIFGMWQEHQNEVLRHRERLALIEKGLPLPPELPQRRSALQIISGATGSEDPAVREQQMLQFIRFLGFLTIGGGVGVFFLLVILSQWEGAVGLGGLMVILGVALILMTVRALRVRNGNS